MEKVSTDAAKKKPLNRKTADILSAVAVFLTIGALLLATVFSSSPKNETVNASGFAIYKGATNEKKAALMFNVYEGAENVENILEILRKYSAKATFFIGGIWAEKNAETLLKIAVSGNELGCHGYLHKDHSKMTVEQNEEEIAICTRLVKNVTGERIKLFAPPSGAYGANTEEACKALGLKLIMWTKDTIDWRDKDVDLLVRRATKNIEKGDLILMHPKDQTVLALPRIIEAYQENGFELVTVSEALN